MNTSETVARGPADTRPANAHAQGSTNPSAARGERSIVSRIGDRLASVGLSVFLLSVLLYLTWRGTIYQKDFGLKRAQEIYFDSWFLIDDLSNLPWGIGDGIKIPMPGAYAVLAVFFVNLVWGGIVRLRKRSATIGVLITHVGIIVLLVASFVKFHYSYEGYLRLSEGKSASDFVSFHDWEIAIGEDQKNGKTTEWIIPEEHLLGVRAVDTAIFEAPDLPFTLSVSNFLENCDITPEAPMVKTQDRAVDGFVLKKLPWNAEAEVNIAGCVATLTPKDGSAATSTLLYGYDFGSQLGYSVGDRRFSIELRRVRFPLPFAVQLDKLHQSTHPGVMIARDYSSDVTRIEGGSTKSLRISMNEPMRHGGYIFFQSKVSAPDRQSDGRWYSIFQVVNNPSDQWPLISCIIIAIGLVIHFGSKLTVFARQQFAKRVTA